MNNLETKVLAINRVRRSVYAAFFMFFCVVSATVLTPKKSWFEELKKPDFETIIPSDFSTWKIDTEVGNSNIIDPQVQDQLSSIYSQIVTRVYVNKVNGRRIMLSVAYGKRQTFGNQLHRPEACYSSQGFKIEELLQEDITINQKSINVSRMSTSQGTRHEYVTYFIRVGDRILRGPATELNKARLHMGIKGYIADGLLFRVSEIGNDKKSSQKLQDQFLYDLIITVKPEYSTTLIP